MKTIYLLRHATAAPASGGGDMERPLQERGRAEAESQGRRFAEGQWPLHAIVTSPALRARQTAEAFATGLGHAPEPETMERLYNAPGEGLLRAIQDLPEAVQAALLVGHMPGVGELLSMLVTGHVDLAVAYPAATLCAVELDVDTWEEADYGTGMLRLCLPPLPVG